MPAYDGYVPGAIQPEQDVNDPAETSPRHVIAADPGDASLGRGLALVRFLRERCPWDARQTPRTLRPYLLEEAHEVADAIESGDDPALATELGDLLLNVAFQIVLAEERESFRAEDVMVALESKMEARHPHVYGDAEAPPDWEELKAAERTNRVGTKAPRGEIEDPFAGVSAGLDPLSRAARVQERMAAFGFDWPDLDGPLGKVREEAAELERVAPVAAARIGEADAAVEEEVGDLLFAAVNAARLAGAHPANALLAAIDKFERRSRAMLRLAEERGIDWRTAGLEALDPLWDEVKAAG